MSIDLLKKNFSLTEFSFIYFKYHKSNLALSTLLYLKNKYFEISLPFYLFHKDNHHCSLKKSFRLKLLHRNTVEAIQLGNFSRLSISQRKTMVDNHLQITKIIINQIKIYIIH